MQLDPSPGEDLALAQDFIAALRQKSSTLPGFASVEADLAVRGDDKEAALAAIDRGLLHNPADPSLRECQRDLGRGAQVAELLRQTGAPLPLAAYAERG